MRYWFLGVILLCFCNLLNAQEKFGAVHSNYSPTNSVHLNPSSMLDAKTWLDIHVVGLGTYLNNNFAAVQNRSIIDLIGAGGINTDQMGYNVTRNKYHAYSRTNISSLSAVLSQGDHAFGMSYNLFAYADIRKVDNSIALPLSQFFQNQNVTDFTDLNIEKLRANVTSYGEAKLSYAYTFKKIYRNMMMFGVSAKKIFPIAGGAAKIADANYTIQSNDLLAINNFQGDVMFGQATGFSLLGGMGLDLGFTYQNMKERCSNYFPNSSKSGCSPKFYKYKLGISIIDIGYVKFNESSTSTYAVDVDSVIFDPGRDNFQTELGNVTTGDEASGINKPNKMGLPTVVSLQFDYNIWANKFYVNGTVVYGVPPFPKNYGVRRANSLSVTPRFETKWFDVALPFSMYEFRQPQLGLSMRLYFLTIGTDKLLNIFVPSDIYGADIYAQLKVPLFRNPKCKDKGFNSKKGRRKRKNLCDAYW
ncbi:MAG: DUF5723 family protein [Crocinitomicaceae bacterium]